MQTRRPARSLLEEKLVEWTSAALPKLAVCNMTYAGWGIALMSLAPRSCRPGIKANISFGIETSSVVHIVILL